MAQPRRILCYGVCGSGKTTLAKDISQITGIPWHSVDDLTWEPGWVMVPEDQQREKIRSIIEQESWILDTAYGKWIDLPLSRCELIVALDYSRFYSFCRLLKRTLQRATDKKLVCNGNIESWSQVCSKDSILLWHMKSFSRKRERIRNWETDSNRETAILRSPKRTQSWLDELQKFSS